MSNNQEEVGKIISTKEDIFSDCNTHRKFIKRIVYKLTSWFIIPMMKKQEEFNDAIIKEVAEIKRNMGFLSEEHEKRLYDLETLRDAHEKRLYDLETLRDAHEKRLYDLETLRDAHEKRLYDLETLRDAYERRLYDLETLRDIYEKRLYDLETLRDAYEKNFEVLDVLKGLSEVCEEQKQKLIDINAMQQKHSMVLSKCANIIDQYENIMVEDNSNFWNKTTTAQCGEDAILQYIFKVLGIDNKKVSYLDLGANHAKDLSNTYCLYKNGARGVLVEANPTLISELKLFRSEDIIINKCVGVKSGETIDFYVLNGDGLSTPDKESVEQVLALNQNLFIDKVVQVETITVEEILNNYFIEAPTLINIDIEGNELQILRTIGLEKWRPLIVICEMIPYNTSLVVGDKNEEIMTYMEQHQYSEFAFTGINSIFIDTIQVKNV